VAIQICKLIPPAMCVCARDRPELLEMPLSTHADGGLQQVELALSIIELLRAVSTDVAHHASEP